MADAAFSPTLAPLAQALIQLGLRELTPVAQGFVGQCSLFPFTVQCEGEHIRMTAVVCPAVPRSRIALWHTVLLGATPVPFGQWAISPNGELVLTALLSAEGPLAHHLPAVAYAMLTAAEAQARQMHADFDALPFNEADLRANLLHLVRSDLRAPESNVFSQEQATLHLERWLQRSYAEALAPIRMGAWALAADHLVQLALEPLPFTRRRSGEADWALVLRTELTTHEPSASATPDAALFIRLNRLNYATWGAAHSLRHAGRRSTLLLTTELPAALIADTAVVQAALDQLLSAARALGQTFPATSATARAIGAEHHPLRDLRERMQPA